MIEFNGLYHSKTDKHPQAVKVQFDGVLLHVWHGSNPLYRLLTSDVFRLPLSITGRIPYILLPSGDRIETDNSDALITIRTNHRQEVDLFGLTSRFKPFIKTFIWCGLVVLLGLCAAQLLL